MKRILCVFGIVTFAVFFLVYLFCLNHIHVNEIGIAYNSVDGEIKYQKHPGWYVTYPTVRVANVSTLPFEVSIMSSARLINRKLIRINPEGLPKLLELEGFGGVYFGTIESKMTGYAYSGQKYPFIDIVQEMKP